MIEFGPFRYDAESRLLRRENQEIALPPRVLAVLESLLKRPGEVVQKDDMLASAWEGAFVGEDSLTQAVSQLRSALGDDPRRPTYIQTIPKRGYRFIAEVSRPLQNKGPIPRPEADGGAGVVLAAAVPAMGSSTQEPDSATPLPGASTPEPLVFAPGVIIGHYQLANLLGAGAMGEVWRARDTHLQRDVAIKVVPKELAAEAAVIERFRREALMLAAVNHPNIATIHSVEEINGTRFIVMELLEGKTLQGRLDEGPLPIDEALEIAQQIARALEVAHDAGIVHRDLKPANIIVSQQGHVKVLDFGLARDANAGDGLGSVDPTLLTASGFIVGTAAYMSPEQAAGKPIDKRSDIFSFGCVLFEMLAGERPFAGEGASEIVAAILKDQPDWDLLPPVTPLTARALVRRCLRKDPDRRLHDIADARIELDEAVAERFAGARPIAPVVAPRGALNPVIPWTIAIVAVVVAVGSIVLGGSEGGTPNDLKVRYLGLHLNLDPEQFLPTRPAISRDGTRVAYMGHANGGRGLHLRSLDQQEATLVPDSEGAYWHFFSPDGNQVGFYTPDGIKKVPFGGGFPSLVTTLTTSGGASWGEGGTIYIARLEEGMYRVPATGGESTLAFAPDVAAGEVVVANPEMLPGTAAMLYDSSFGGRLDDEPIAVFDFRTSERRQLIAQGSTPQYASSGHVVYARRGQLFTVPFDLDQLRVTGDPLLVLDSVFMYGTTSLARYDISQDGTLVYARGGDWVENRRLFVVDEDGNETVLGEERGSPWFPRFSPDGRQVAFANQGGELWIYDLARRRPTRLSFNGVKSRPVWSPNGQRIAFGAAQRGPWQVFVGSSDDNGEASLLWKSDNATYPVSWSPDGNLLAIEDVHTETGYDISILRLDGAPVSPEPFLHTEFREAQPMFSPSGPWIAYESDQSGRSEVYVDRYPRSPRVPNPIPISTGSEPIWAPNGSRLYFLSSGRIMAVDVVQRELEFTFSEPRVFYSGSLGRRGNPSYDVASDGRIVAVRDELPPQPNYHIVLNWFEELKRLAPPGR